MLKSLRFYQTRAGVYGYKPRLKEFYKINDDIRVLRNSQSTIYRWIENYRRLGHKLAKTNPINIETTEKIPQELDYNFYDLQSNDTVKTKGIINVPHEILSIEELDKILRKIYCGNVSIEYSYIENEKERDWLSEKFENFSQQSISDVDKKQILELLNKCEIWDHFVATKFPTVKRYGAEGAENIITFFRQLFISSLESNVKNVVIGMPHRGRTNLLTTLLNIRPAMIFRKFQGYSELPNDIDIPGDIVSHLGASTDISINGKCVHISVCRNPSHLEAVNPVSMGKTRSKQQTAKDGCYDMNNKKLWNSTVLNVQVHGDAAFSGQGINQECLMMSGVPHFEIGGTIHLIVNNNIGFTTPGERTRTGAYASDLAKSIQAPVFHVNGDDPEATTKITQLAFEYQQQFRKDIFLDLQCFRKWGHNELDDPTITNPLLYSIINKKKSVPTVFEENLINTGVISSDEANQMKLSHMQFLKNEFDSISTYEPELNAFKQQWSNFTLGPNSLNYWDSGLDYSILQYVGNMSVIYPKEFNIHPHLLKTFIQGRKKKLETGQNIDWATAEALAIGSLMYQNHNVRLSGEDVGRGTFSHRHVMLVDQKTNEIFIPFNNMPNVEAKLEIANSILSEEAVLGYEYGMSIDNPNNLIIWEAQFGDFFNGAQIIIDNFISSGESKWLESSGLVMLLPHGFDGAASEHSSCRLERFLQLSDSKEDAVDGDNVNMHIINPTTPAQYYHALRRQIIRNFRKPLIVVSPKILLRLSDATSTHCDMQPGTYFKNVIGDFVAEPNKVKTIILCSGKHFYVLNSHRLMKNIDDVAIIRLESLCPFPAFELLEQIQKYKNVKKFIWSQEEPRNMGAWNFIKPRFEFLSGQMINYCGRSISAATATGSGKVHQKECDEILQETFQN